MAQQGKQLTDDVRAAVMAALLAGQGVCEVARQFKVSKSTVSEMRKEISPDHFEQLRKWVFYRRREGWEREERGTLRSRP